MRLKTPFRLAGRNTGGGRATNINSHFDVSQCAQPRNTPFSARSNPLLAKPFRAVLLVVLRGDRHVLMVKEARFLPLAERAFTERLSGPASLRRVGLLGWESIRAQDLDNPSYPSPFSWVPSRPEGRRRGSRCFPPEDAKFCAWSGLKGWGWRHWREQQRSGLWQVVNLNPELRAASLACEL